MGSEGRTETAALSFLAEVSEKPYQYGFFQTVRRINCFYNDKPLTGQSFRPSDDPIRFTQEPYTFFAPATLGGLKIDGSSPYPQLSQRFLGLFGPNGPLPLHLTEYARDRSRHHRDHSLAAFADMFHHRVVSLFYAAWAQSQPVVQFDRPGEDRFAMYVGSLIGLGPKCLRGLDGMHHVSKLAFAGHLSSLPRHVNGLVSLIEGYFNVPTAVREFIAHWMHIPPNDLVRLGEAGMNGCLGQNTIIGERVWQRQDKFQLRLGPLSLDRYEAFLPTGKSFNALVAAVRNYVGIEFLWEVNLILKKEEKPVTCLGKSGALGWTSWLETDSRVDHVDDLLLQVQNYVN
ncbi:MAG: type VI secretion system baseplate subunit TssG [Lysobacterales bacterium]